MCSQEHNWQPTFQNTICFLVIDDPYRYLSSQIGIHNNGKGTSSHLAINRFTITPNNYNLRYYDKYNYYSVHMIIAISTNMYNLYFVIPNNKQAPNIYFILV